MFLFYRNSSQITQKRLQVDQEKKRLENQRQEVESMIATLKQDLRLNAHNKERQTEEYESVKMQKKSLQHKIGNFINFIISNSICKENHFSFQRTRTNTNGNIIKRSS